MVIFNGINVKRKIIGSRSAHKARGWEWYIYGANNIISYGNGDTGIRYIQTWDQNPKNKTKKDLTY